MSSVSEIQSLALKLPQRSRLKLAGELLRSVTPGVTSADVLEEASKRDAELESGKVKPLTESEFWAGVSRPRNLA
jgi:hypothetical protein